MSQDKFIARIKELEDVLRFAKPIVGAAVAASTNESRPKRESVYNRIVAVFAKKEEDSVPK